LRQKLGTSRCKNKLNRHLDCGKLSHRWDKNGWTGVKVQMRRKGDSTWTDLGIDLQSPMMDKTPLLVANQPEIREYRMQYLDGDELTGSWSDIVSVTTT